MKRKKTIIIDNYRKEVNKTTKQPHTNGTNWQNKNTVKFKTNQKIPQHVLPYTERKKKDTIEAFQGWTKLSSQSSAHIYG